MSERRGQPEQMMSRAEPLADPGDVRGAKKINPECNTDQAEHPQPPPPTQPRLDAGTSDCVHTHLCEANPTSQSTHNLTTPIVDASSSDCVHTHFCEEKPKMICIDPKEPSEITFGPQNCQPRIFGPKNPPPSPPPLNQAKKNQRPGLKIFNSDHPPSSWGDT